MTRTPIKVVQLAYGGMALAVFEALNADPNIDVCAIVTPEADDPLYRGSAKLSQEMAAEQDGVAVIRTASLQTLHEAIEKLSPDLVVIATFHRIIPRETLDLSRFINIHHGKLPRQRGRANVNWAIINGEPSVSVSIHEAVLELDAGDIIKQFHVEIHEDDNVSDLYDRINETLQTTLPSLFTDYLDGKIDCQEQNQSRATYYCTRLPNDGLIDWTLPRDQILRLIRAVCRPFPGAYTFLNGRKMMVWSAALSPASRTFEGIIPGRVVRSELGEGVEVLASDGPILLREVEIDEFCGDPAEIIKSSLVTLGVSLENLLNRVADLEQQIHDIAANHILPKNE